MGDSGHLMLQRDFCAYTTCHCRPSLWLLRHIEPSFDRDTLEAMARRRRSLYVGTHVSGTVHTAAHMTRTYLFNERWEFVATLDYEWSIIRGHRPYRWTIWVCNEGLFSALFRHSWSLGLTFVSIGLLFHARHHPLGRSC